MEVHRFGIKLFVDNPQAINLQDFVPIFHGWIQKQAMEGHLLIDVHDYSHIHEGPGVLLVAHEANISVDMGQGCPGLIYYRKEPVDGSAENRLFTVLKSALQACSLLEDEPSLKTRVRFRTDEILLFANDRLLAPNEEATFSTLKPVLLHLFKQVFDGADFRVDRTSEDPKERFTVRIETSSSVGVPALLSRTAVSRS